MKLIWLRGAVLTRQLADGFVTTNRIDGAVDVLEISTPLRNQAGLHARCFGNERLGYPVFSGYFHMICGGRNADFIKSRDHAKESGVSFLPTVYFQLLLFPDTHLHSDPQNSDPGRQLATKHSSVVFTARWLHLVCSFFSSQLAEFSAIATRLGFTRRFLALSVYCLLQLCS
jgi:hypothetical protein